MSQKQDIEFDPYHTWLGIPPDDQPPNHYRLLGLALFEENHEVIEVSADRQMHHLRRFQSGQRGGLVQPILQEVSSAKLCLLDGKKKAKYDAELRQSQTSTASTSAPKQKVDTPNLPQPSMGVEATTKPLSPSPPPASMKNASSGSTPTPVVLKPVGARPASESPGFGQTPDLGGPLTLSLPNRSAAQNSSSFEWSRLAVPVIVLAIGVPIAVVLFVLFAFVIRPQTGNGVVAINSPESPMTLLLRSADGEQKSIDLDGSPVEVSLTAGDYEVELADGSDGRWEVSENRFELKPGERFEVRVVEKRSRDESGTTENPQVAQSDTTVSGQGTGSGTSEMEHENYGDGNSNASSNSEDNQSQQNDLHRNGAVVSASRMVRLEFGRPNELPGLVQKAFTFRFDPQPTSADIRNGILEFSVEKDGIVYLVTSTQYEGNRYGGWYEERLTKDDLVGLGWADLGQCPWRPKETLLVREVRAGEKYRIRTNKYSPPQLITPESNGI